MITDADLKRGIRAWANRLHIPVTRMMSRVLREEIHHATHQRHTGETTMKEQTTIQDAQSRLQEALAVSAVYSLRERVQISHAVTAIVDAVLAERDNRASRSEPQSERIPEELVPASAFRAWVNREMVRLLPPEMIGQPIQIPHSYGWRFDNPSALTLYFREEFGKPGISEAEAKAIFTLIKLVLDEIAGPPPGIDPPAPFRPSPPVIEPAYGSPAWWDAIRSGSFAPSRIHLGCGWIKRETGMWGWRFEDGTFPNPDRDRPGDHWDGNIYPPGHRSHPDYAHLFTQA